MHPQDLSHPRSAQANRLCTRCAPTVKATSKRVCRRCTPCRAIGSSFEDFNQLEKNVVSGTSSSPKGLQSFFVSGPLDWKACRDLQICSPCFTFLQPARTDFVFVRSSSLFLSFPFSLLRCARVSAATTRLWQIFSLFASAPRVGKNLCWLLLPPVPPVISISFVVVSVSTDRQPTNLIDTCSGISPRGRIGAHTQPGLEKGEKLCSK